MSGPSRPLKTQRHRHSGSGDTMRPGRASSRRTVSWNCICCRTEIFARISRLTARRCCRRRPELTPASQPAQRLRQLESGTTTEAALAFFDLLPPVQVATLIGSWRGKGLETGHPMDGLLERFGWHGKRFTGPDGAHPLVFEPDERRRIQRKSRDDPGGLRAPPRRSIPAPAGQPGSFGHLGPCFGPTSRRRGCA